MSDTLRILSTHTVFVLLSAVGAVGCQGEHAALRAAMELSPAPFLPAKTIGSAMPDRDDIVAPVSTHSVTGTTASGAESNAGTTSAVNPGASSTQPGASALRMPPRQNPHAEDLLDHWGHRSVETVPESLGLFSSDDDGTNLQTFRSAAASASSETVAPHLAEGDTVEVLGERRGVRYGRWTGGPADTLSIEFNFDHASRAIREDRVFQASVDRAGKAWSNRIADDWSAWHRPEGTIKARLIRNGGTGDSIPVAPGGETSTGLEIFVTEHDAIAGTGRVPSRGGPRALRTTTKWEPHTGAIEFAPGITSYPGANIIFVAVHETGHVLGSWYDTGDLTTYINRESGMWHGPNVVAVHGRPAPFQDELDPHTSVDGERSAGATVFDFNHSGVCASIMAYCRSRGSILPHEIDYAFLADIGMTIIEASDRPETYGFGVWTDHAGAGVSVARTLRLGRNFDSFQSGLETIDRLEARVDAFGHRSTGDLRLSYGIDTLLGTARFAGGLFGTALELEGLPPVTGDANLEVDLDVLRGDARFTSLEVFERGTGTVFGSGALHYPFELSGNTILGTKAGTSLRADFYGPRHEDIAGTLRDPFAGLLAGFAAAFDARPAREEILLVADYATGHTYRSVATVDAFNDVAEYACVSRSSCLTRTALPLEPWREWTETTYEDVVKGTTGTNVNAEVGLIADRKGFRIEHQATHGFEPGGGSYTVNAYLASMEHATFSTGFQRYSRWTGEPEPLGPDYFEVWNAVHGAASGSLPRMGSARWTGVMLGYDQRAERDASPHVHGTATVDYRFSTDTLDVELANIRSRDAKSTLDDIRFEDIAPTSEGTFRLSDRSGYIEGALFGPGHEEAAGRFQSRECDPSSCVNQVVGTFGGTAVAADPTLAEHGSVRLVSGYRVGGKPISIHRYGEWGLRGTKFGEALLVATIDSEGGTYPKARFEGAPTGTNPVRGTAVWTGRSRAFEKSTEGLEWYTPVSGDARLEANLGAGTIDVDLTGFERGHPDVSWDGLPLEAGMFEHTDGNESIEGRFYGDEHEGVAGSFATSELKGLFGALRESDDAADFDARPTREEILLAASYATGQTYRRGATDTELDGHADHECTSRSSCRTRTARSSESGSEWTETTFEHVVDETAGAEFTMHRHRIVGREGVRVERAATHRVGPGGRSHDVNAYLGSMEHATFATGVRQYDNWTGEPDPLGPDYFEMWNAVHGAASGSLPRMGSARWTGVMLGYDQRAEGDASPHVHGTATVDYRFSTDTLDVELANIRSRDAKSTLDDIRFEDIAPTSEGTFRLSDRSGYIEGALFGPGHEEAAGRFQSRECDPSSCVNQVVGTFGGTAVAADPTLAEHGSVRLVSGYRVGGKPISIHRYGEWGLRGTKFGEALLVATIDSEGGTYPKARFEGAPTGTNPVRGTAVWTGRSRAFEKSTEGLEWYTPVSGDARLEANLGAGTIDVGLTGFERGHPDVSWDGLPLEAGMFEHTDGNESIEGRFYGDEHEGVAGSFATSELKGLFGALRESDDAADFDARPTREEILLAASYATGQTYRRGATDTELDGHADHECTSRSSCRTRTARPSESGSEWNETTFEHVVDETAGADVTMHRHRIVGREGVRVERAATHRIGSGGASHDVNAYLGSMEHATFATGVRQYDNWTGEPDPLGPDYFEMWNAVHGAASGSLPRMGSARWTGVMLGYDQRAERDASPHVHGTATVDYRFSTDTLDVELANIRSRDAKSTLDDIRFEDIAPTSEGTFRLSDRSGYIEGALFGPGHEEAAGRFQSRECGPSSCVNQVVGTFGGTAVAADPTLAEHGSVRLVSGYRVGGKPISIHRYGEWGLRGTKFGEALLVATIDSEGGTYPKARFEGAPTGTNPVRGTAVWTGRSRAFEKSTEGLEWYTPVKGDARLEANLGAGTIDVDLTGFERDHPDVSWDGLPLEAGMFEHTDGNESIEGRFYGDEHEGVAGSFATSELKGLFGALRESDDAADFDARPTREEILLAASYATGQTYRRGATDTELDGHADHECTSRSSCRTRTARPSESGSEWTETTFEHVVDETAGAEFTMHRHRIVGREGVRVERAATHRIGSGGRSHDVNAYLGSMEHATFATGVRQYDNWTGEPDPLGPGYFEMWNAVHGAASGSLPRMGSARWTGVMLGYDQRAERDASPHVHGTATVDYRFSTDTLDVELANIRSRDAKSTLDDIRFEDIAPTSEGTFRLSDRSGYIEGALFGPGHEEAAGRFQSRECGPSSCVNQVVGTFGGTAVPADPTFEARGSVNRNEYPQRDGTTAVVHSYEDWGLWGTKFGEELFGAFLDRESNTTVPSIRFEGLPSGANPVQGNAVWTGETRAFERRPDPEWFTPVKGDARLEADFDSGTIDIDLTGFERGHPDVSWDSVPLVAGAFEQTDQAVNFAGRYYGTLNISGKLHGPEHEGAVGSFGTPLLEGVFAATREP